MSTETVRLIWDGEKGEGVMEREREIERETEREREKSKLLVCSNAEMTTMFSLSN